MTREAIQTEQLYHILVDKTVNFVVITAGCCVVVFLCFFKLRPCAEIAHNEITSKHQQIMPLFGLTILQLLSLADLTTELVDRRWLRALYTQPAGNATTGNAGNAP